jgi:hypothetical protein
MFLVLFILLRPPKMLLSPLGISIQTPEWVLDEGWSLGPILLIPRDKSPLTTHGVDWCQLLEEVDPQEYSDNEKRGKYAITKNGKQYELALYLSGGGGRADEIGKLYLAGHRVLSRSETDRLLPFCDCVYCNTFKYDFLTHFLMCPCCTGCISERNGAFSQHHRETESRIRRAEEIANGRRSLRVFSWREKLCHTDPLAFVCLFALLFLLIMMVTRMLLFT